MQISYDSKMKACNAAFNVYRRISLFLISLPWLIDGLFRIHRIINPTVHINKTDNGSK